MRLAAGVLVGLSLAAGAARAEELVAIKPGVMCVSTDALARLTLHGGDSKTHLANPSPADLDAAASGGCIDIPLGARVTVLQAFRNTSRVVYAGAGAPPGGILTVPNIDFRPSGETEAAAPARPALPDSVPAGYDIGQRVPVGDGKTILLLQDRRLTPAIREAMEPSGGDPDMAFDTGSAPQREFTSHPLVEARLMLLSGDGGVVGRTQLDRPLATLKPARLQGWPTPLFYLEVNYRTGMGGFNGPLTALLAPQQQGLAPLQAAPATGGQSEPITLSSTLHAGWRVVPGRNGTDEIQQATCPASGTGGRTLRLRTYRFRDQRWLFDVRDGGPCTDLETMPDRRLFP